MSDLSSRGGAGVGGSGPTPASLPEPPYYAVIFTSLRRTDGGAADADYAATAARMAELVRDMPGFLGMDAAHPAGALGITVGYFRDEEAIKLWRANLEHLAAQEQGRREWYERYSVHVAKVERSYTFERGSAGRA